jgi:hypothetical protein
MPVCGGNKQCCIRKYKMCVCILHACVSWNFDLCVGIMNKIAIDMTRMIISHRNMLRLCIIMTVGQHLGITG